VETYRFYRVIRHADKIPDLELPYSMRTFKPFDGNDEIITQAVGRAGSGAAAFLGFSLSRIF
jgi:hypothetical protein